MLNRTCIAAILFAGICLAQTTDASKFYKLDFVLKEVEGTKVLNARMYSTMISTDKGSSSSIRAGSKVPYVISTAGGSNQYNYAEVGVNIDCRAATEMGGQLSLTVNAEMSTTAQETLTPTPIIRQNKWAATVLVPVGKAALIFSSDDATSKHQMHLELTATPVR